MIKCLQEEGGYAMVEKINVISVNPGAKPKGAMQNELFNRLATPIKILDNPVRHTKFRPLINFLSGINSNVNTAWSVKLLMVRLIAGATLLVTGILNYHGIYGYNVPSMLITLGVAMIIGLFSRILSGVGAVVFASVMALAYFGMTTPYLPYTVLTEGVLNYGYLLSSVLLILCAMIGPGRFSLDQLIRAAILQYRKNALKRKRASAIRKAEMRMTYKSFRYSS